MACCWRLPVAGARCSRAARWRKPKAQELERGREIGEKAYFYGQPLLDMERIFHTSTSVTVATENGYAPVNQFSHFKHLVTTNESVVVAPNDDTLYATGWLELKKQPMVVHVPAASRFDVVEMVSPYTENFANVGTEASGLLPPGDYLVAGPGTDEGMEEVDGLKVIHSPYDRVWLIGRVVVEGPSDTGALPIEEQMKIVPLKNWLKEGLNYEPKPPRKEVTEPTVAHIPGTAEHEKPAAVLQGAGEGAEEVHSTGSGQTDPRRTRRRQHRPRQNAEQGQRRQGRDRRPGRSRRRRSHRRSSWRSKKPILSGFAKHNGWLVVGAGKYGTNYLLRAEVDRLGVGALSPNVSIYPLALTDDTTAKLNGQSKRYVVHFPASDFPFPVKAFWSLTMYEASGFFVSNPLERFAIGNRSPGALQRRRLAEHLHAERRTDERTAEGELAARPRRRIPCRDPSVCHRTAGHRTDPGRDRELADTSDRTVPGKRLHRRRSGMSELRARRRAQLGVCSPEPVAPPSRAGGPGWPIQAGPRTYVVGRWLGPRQPGTSAQARTTPQVPGVPQTGPLDVRGWSAQTV